MGRAPFTKWKGAGSASERRMADVQSPEATLCASALRVLVLPHFLLHCAVSLNDSRRLSDKIILCQSARSVETPPGRRTRW
jgi:hypothetical protein